MVTVSRAEESDMALVAGLLHLLWRDEGCQSNDPASDVVTFRENLITTMRANPEIVTIYVAWNSMNIPCGCIVTTYVEAIRTGIFSGLKVLYFAPKGTALALMDAAATRLTEQGAMRAIATASATGQRGTRKHMTYENCGLHLESMTHSGDMAEVMEGVRRRVNHGKRP